MNAAERVVKQLTGLDLGQEVTLRATVAGVVSLGQEVQLLLPDGSFIYIPMDTLKKAVGL